LPFPIRDSGSRAFPHQQDRHGPGLATCRRAGSAFSAVATASSARTPTHSQPW